MYELLISMAKNNVKNINGNKALVLSVVLRLSDRGSGHLVPENYQRRRELLAQAAFLRITFHFQIFFTIFVVVAVFVVGRFFFQFERVLPDPVHQAFSPVLDVLLS